MKLINNWQKMWKSYAVWLPTVAVFALAMLDAAMQTQLVPTAWLPVVVAISGFLGRIIKQPNMRG